MPTDDDVRAATSRWLERAVIGLNLCPFAKAVHAKGQVHFAVSTADSAAKVLEDLARELDALVARDAQERDTTLLVVPRCLDSGPCGTCRARRLREASIDKAVRAFPNAEAIFGANLDTLRKLGVDGWAALDVGPTR